MQNALYGAETDTVRAIDRSVLLKLFGRLRSMNRLGLSLVSGLVWCLFAAPTRAEEDVEFFETRVRPVLVKHCYECHSSSSADPKGGLLVDSREGLRQGGESGPAIVPGQINESLLLQAIRYDSIEMPPIGKLPDSVIADFEHWIQRGAVDPRDAPPSAIDAAASLWKEQLAERRDWWSLQAPNAVSPPEVQDESWSIEPVDRFVRAALEEAELTPAAPADEKKADQ